MKKDTGSVSRALILGLFVAAVLVQVGQKVYMDVLPYHLGGQDEIPLSGMTGEYDHSDERGEFHGEVVYSKPFGQAKMKQVLGIADDEVEKRIEIDLTDQKLYALEDGVRVAEFMVSTGKWGRTPTGTYRMWTKMRLQKMSGGSKALGTYYYLPNVPYIMFFYNQETPKSMGYGIHGAYWHSNFGTTISHGCINMRIRDAEKLYYWADPDVGDERMVKATGDNPGTEVVIYGKSVDG